MNHTALSEMNAGNSIKGSGVRGLHKGYRVYRKRTTDIQRMVVWEQSEGGPGPESARKLREGYRDRLTEYISWPVGKLPLASDGRIPILGRIMYSESNREAPEGLFGGRSR
jgi:hypothetical protein